MINPNSSKFVLQTVPLSIQPERGYEQQEPCILVQRLTDYSDGTSSNQWQCELSAVDTEASGLFFVDIEGLSEDELQDVASGVTSLFVKGGIIANGKLVVPPVAEKTFARIEKRGPAARNKANTHASAFDQGV